MVSDEERGVEDEADGIGEAGEEEACRLRRSREWVGEGEEEG